MTRIPAEASKCSDSDADAANSPGHGESSGRIHAPRALPRMGEERLP
jgi:hypothetical protein